MNNRKSKRKSSILIPFKSYKELQSNDNNNVINLYNDNEPLNVLMSGIISKINVRNAGLKEETIINVKQKIFSQELNKIDNDGLKNMNNYQLQNNLNNINNNLRKKRFSTAYENFLRKQTTLMKTGKKKKKNEKKIKKKN